MRTTDKRGSSRDRKARKAYLLQAFNATCVWCAQAVTAETLHADRIFAGGSYARSNLIASCATCNMNRKDKPAHVYLALCNAPAHAHKVLQKVLKVLDK